MNGEADDVEKVSIPKNQLMLLLDAAREVRSGFLLCAPRFAAGSRGESMVSVAAELGKVIGDIWKQLDVQQKADPGK